MVNGFSADVEDWYQGIELPANSWHAYEKRIAKSTDVLLELLDRHNIKITCFILGKIAEEHPGIVKQIHRAGHEVATHGYSHEKVYAMGRKQFQTELRRSIALLQDITGEKIIGHRAPYFSITRKSLWALDILAEEGILYDSSIQPVSNYRYGIPDADRLPSCISLNNGLKIIEIPVSTWPVYKANLPIGGGAYLRIYPLWLLKRCLKMLEARNEKANLYIHPWELDAAHPVIRLPLRIAATHYINLTTTFHKLHALFMHFKFAPYAEVHEELINTLRAAPCGIDAAGAGNL